MNLSFGALAFLTILSSVAYATEGSGNVAKLCNCLSEPPTLYDGERDGTPVVSVFVPPQFVRSESNNCDSQRVKWMGGRSLSLGVDSQTSDVISSPDFGSLSPNECIGYINEDRVLVGYRSERDVKTLLARFETMEHGGNPVHFSATAKSPEALCDLARPFLWSAVLVNRWQSLKIRFIAGDRRSFAYSNEVGEVRAAKTGHIISKDFGRVSAIRESSVEIIEMVPNGLGGYVEVKREIPFVVQ